MWNNKGKNDIQALLRRFDYIVGECDKRLAEGADPALEQLRKQQAALREKLADATFAKTAAKANLTRTDDALRAMYDEARTGYQRGKAMVYALYGPRSFEAMTFGVGKANGAPRTTDEIQTIRATRAARRARSASATGDSTTTADGAATGGVTTTSEGAPAEKKKSEG